MKKTNRGAISIFALLSMMFFLIFIMVAYNNVMQKSKVQVETEGILYDYYKPTQTATEIVSDEYVENVKLAELRDKELKMQVLKSGNNGKYIYSNGKTYKINNDTKEYQQVEYIQSSGTQYIDTGINPTGMELGIDMTFQMINTSHDKWFFGENYYSGGDKGCVQFGVYSGKFAFIYSLDNRTNLFRTLTIAADTNKHNIKFNITNYGATFDGETLNNPNGSQQGNIIDKAYYNICIFARGGNLNTGFRASVKVYDLKLYNGTQIIGEYIPCYKVSDGEIGMYDVINDIFYTNAGTGTFVKGSDV